MSRSERGAAVRFVALVVVLAVVAAGAVGVGVASGQTSASYSLRGGDQCATITPLSGNEPVREFYAYQSPFEENPYTTELGQSYSSEGTADLQENETSLLFLYRAPDGTLSLVMVHGTRGQGTDGGAATFEIDGLPADGVWAVKDDQYNNSHNYDRWRHSRTAAEIDWTWSGNATDGGAFAGLGDDFRVTIDPAFNEEAALFGEHYDGTVEEWQALSGDRGDPERISLDRSESVIISTEPCDGSETVPGEGTDDQGAGQGESDRETETTEDETETEDVTEATEDEDTETTEDDDRGRDEDDRTDDGVNRDDDEDGRTDAGEDRDTERTGEDDRGRDGNGPPDDAGRDGSDGPGDGGPDGTDGGGPFGEDGPFGGDGPIGGDGPFDDGGLFGDGGPFDGNDTEG